MAQVPRPTRLPGIGPSRMLAYPMSSLLRSPPAQDDPRGSAVEPLQAYRRGYEVVPTGLDARQVQSFDDADPGGEQDPVRVGPMIHVSDRQVVDPHGPDASLDQIIGR